MIRFTIMDSAGTKFNPLTLRANGELQITDSASVAAGGFRFNGTNLQWSDDLSTWSNFSSGSNWTRAGTTLSPAVAGDDIAVDAVDAAPVGDTGNYVKTRKFEFVDANGGADFFDARAFVHATIGQRYLEFRDNAGTPLVQFWRQETGSVAVDYADVFVDLRPDTDGGQALGSTSAPRYWGSAAINTITANQLTPKSVGNSDIGGTGSAFGDAYVSTLWNNAFRIDSGGGSDMFFEGNLLPWTNEGHNLGAQATRWNVVHGRRWESYDGTYSRIVLNNPGASSNAGSAISVLNASGVSMLSLSYAGSLSSVNITATGNLYTYGVLELEDDDQSNYVRVQAPSAVSSDYTITVPAADCASGEFLTLGSSGTMSCSTPGGASLPVADTQTIVKGSADATKLIRFEVDGLTTGTTRVMTPPNANATLAGINIAQTWTATQSFGGGSYYFDISGNVNAASYLIGGVTIFDSSRYWNTGSGSFEPSSSAVASLGSPSRLWNELYMFGAITQNGTSRLSSGGVFNGASFNVAGTEVISSGRVFKPVSLDVNGTANVIDSGRNANVVSITVNGSYGITSAGAGSFGAVTLTTLAQGFSTRLDSSGNASFANITTSGNLTWSGQTRGPYTADTGLSFASSAGKIAYYDTAGNFKGWIPVLP